MSEDNKELHAENARLRKLIVFLVRSFSLKRLRALRDTEDYSRLTEAERKEVDGIIEARKWYDEWRRQGKSESN